MNSAPAARGSQEAVFTQPMAQLLADPLQHTIQVELRRQQSDAMEKKRSRSRSGGSRGMNQYGDGGGASRFAYTNRLEILDEED